MAELIDIYVFQLLNGILNYDEIDYMSVINKACDCGSKDGELCIDPYAEDIYNTKVLTFLCEQCYADSCDDI